MRRKNQISFVLNLVLILLLFSGPFGVIPTRADPSVVLEWAKSMGGVSFDQGYNTAVDNSGNVYTTGYFYETVDFDPGIGTRNLTSAGDEDIFISKLDSNGNFVWAKSMGGVSNDSSYAIGIDSNDNVYTTGFFQETVDFDPGPGTSNLTSVGDVDLFVVKLTDIPQVHYVKWDATGANNGTSWIDAYIDLQTALTVASSGDEIWVAAGTYRPTITTDRAISFNLKNGVSVFGGFAGTETESSQRDYENNLTILSGDIGIQDDKSDNSYHVVVANNTNTSALVDGFTITGGNADDAIINSGGGMDVKDGSPSLRNVIFTDNYADFGGGMHAMRDTLNNPDSISPILTNVTFHANSAVEGGGMRNFEFSSPILTNVIFDSNSVTRTGGGMENFNYSNPALTNVIFINNTAGELGAGGGMFNWVGNIPILMNVTFTGNTAQWGGGMGNYQSSPILRDVVFNNNSASWYGGGMTNENNSNPRLTDVTFDGNTAVSDTEETAAGGMHNRQSSPILTNVTFKDNSANYIGGGMVNGSSSSPTLENVTFSKNTADYGGAMLNSDLNSNPTLTHVTMSNNTASIDGGAIANAGNPVIRNSILWGNSGGEIFNVSGTPVITYSIVQGGYAGTGNIDQDPVLGPLQDNGGSTQTMALGSSSPAIDAADNANCPDNDQRGVVRPQGSHCDIGAFERETLANVKVDISGNIIGDNIEIPLQTSQRMSFAGLDNGPVLVDSTNGLDIVTALRVIWQEPGVRTSYSEMMGLPGEQLSDEYWFPWYNNLSVNSMDQGFRIANVDSASNTVMVYVGGALLDTLNLSAGESVRIGYPVDNGPVRIVCTTCSNLGIDKIIASLRVIWKEPGFRSSYSEMMGLPKEQLSNEYWFPWYNNAAINSMDQGFRIANVDGGSNTVEVYVAGSLLDTINLPGGQSVRVGYNVNNGPAKIVCITCSNTGTDKIITSLRVIWKEPGLRTSYSEMMGLPLEQLATEYWFPWYNNATTTSMDQGFRIANVNATSSNTVEVWVGNSVTPQDTITLAIGQSVRVGYNVDTGPIRIVCTTCSGNEKIITALRVIWTETGVLTSYSEMMGLPDQSLSSEYWFPWYNNAVPATMDQGFRIAVP